MFRGVSTGILAPKAFGRPCFDAMICRITGVTNCRLSIAIPVAGKEGRSQSEEIGRGSHDEVGGGIGFIRFGQCSMG